MWRIPAYHDTQDPLVDPSNVLLADGDALMNTSPTSVLPRIAGASASDPSENPFTL